MLLRGCSVGEHSTEIHAVSFDLFWIFGATDEGRGALKGLVSSSVGSVYCMSASSGTVLLPVLLVIVNIGFLCRSPATCATSKSLLIPIAKSLQEASFA
uniref:Uncharacterized protein n=1 Tax=Arundo donax TaxID=35708 RepID=A0A0A9G018_ARUDO